MYYANCMLNKKLYSNPLANSNDVIGFVKEGQVRITFPNNRMRMESVLDPIEGQKANFVFWCPMDFPSDIAVKWDFWPLNSKGLGMIFFSATGINGEDLFSSDLLPRDGRYEQYYNGDINAYHASYFRHSAPNENSFQTCNLRKSKGFYLVCQGPDPIPACDDAREGPYHMMMTKHGGHIAFYINDLLIFKFNDNGKTYGSVLDSGKIGLRQMAPLVGEYANLEVYSIAYDD